LRATLSKLKKELPREELNGVTWYWPDQPRLDAPPHEQVRLLAPFDPLVWDRRRFELLWGWAYRFEAYTPIARRVRGYYALPLLWREEVIGWANVNSTGTELGYVSGAAPKEKSFKRELEAELGRLQAFLQTETNPRNSEGLPSSAP
jgi:uncharacterized protein YcaQ